MGTPAPRFQPPGQHAAAAPPATPLLPALQCCFTLPSRTLPPPATAKQDTEDFEAWLAGFDLAAQRPAIDALLAENTFMSELQASRLLSPLFLLHSPAPYLADPAGLWLAARPCLVAPQKALLHAPPYLPALPNQPHARALTPRRPASCR